MRAAEIAVLFLSWGKAHYHKSEVFTAEDAEVTEEGLIWVKKRVLSKRCFFTTELNEDTEERPKA